MFLENVGKKITVGGGGVREGRSDYSKPNFVFASLKVSGLIKMNQLMFELMHDKTYKMVCAQRRLRPTCASTESDR